MGGLYKGGYPQGHKPFSSSRDIFHLLQFTRNPIFRGKSLIDLSDVAIKPNTVQSIGVPSENVKFISNHIHKTMIDAPSENPCHRFVR